MHATSFKKTTPAPVSLIDLLSINPRKRTSTHLTTLRTANHLEHRLDPLNAFSHSPFGRYGKPDTTLGLTIGARPFSMPSLNHSSILSYYDKHNANRFHWQERFASSSNRLTFSSRECGRVNSSPPGCAFGISGPWAGRTLSFKRLLTHQTEDMPTVAQTE